MNKRDFIVLAIGILLTLGVQGVMAITQTLTAHDKALVQISQYLQQQQAISQRPQPARPANDKSMVQGVPKTSPKSA